MRVRENAESIAFYGGEDNEQRLLNARLRAAVDNFLGAARGPGLAGVQWVGPGGRGWQACEGWGKGRADRRSKAAAGWRVGCRECKGQGPAVQAGGV